MRILFLSNFYPPYALGGWEQNCQEIVDCLRARGHTCHVLTSRFGIIDSTPVEDGIERSLHLQADIHHYRPLDFFVRNPGQGRSNRAALQRVIKQVEPELIFVWGLWNLDRSLAYWAEQWLPGRVAYAVAGYWFVQPDTHTAYWQGRSRRPWVEFTLGPLRRLALALLARERSAQPLALEHVAFVSDFVRQKHHQAGINPRDGRVIYNGIDPAPFVQAAAQRRPDPTRLRLVYTGGLVAHKGVNTAIEALGLLHQSGRADGVSLTLVGGGHPDYETNLRQRVADLGIGARVIFCGRVPREEIATILAAHDVFLFTSVYEEPIARTVMEAMAAGLTVIATPVGGQVEMLSDGDNCLVYPPGDAAQLAAQIARLDNDRELCVCLAEAGRTLVVERFSLARMVDEMEDWLQEIVACVS